MVEEKQDEFSLFLSRELNSDRKIIGDVINKLSSVKISIDSFMDYYFIVKKCDKCNGAGYERDGISGSYGCSLCEGSGKLYVLKKGK